MKAKTISVPVLKNSEPYTLSLDLTVVTGKPCSGKTTLMNYIHRILATTGEYSITHVYAEVSNVELKNSQRVHTADEMLDCLARVHQRECNGWYQESGLQPVLLLDNFDKILHSGRYSDADTAYNLINSSIALGVQVIIVTPTTYKDELYFRNYTKITVSGGAGDGIMFLDVDLHAENAVYKEQSKLTITQAMLKEVAK